MKLKLILTIIPFLFFSCKALDLGKQKSAKKPVEAQKVTKNEVILDQQPQASEDFVQGSDDLPLLVGMEKTSDEGLGFDSSSGSIISSSYESKIGLEKIREFYLATLPQMGWVLKEDKSEKSTFERDKEKLEIEFGNSAEKTLITFFISSSI